MTLLSVTFRTIEISPELSKNSTIKTSIIYFLSYLSITAPWQSLEYTREVCSVYNLVYRELQMQISTYCTWSHRQRSAWFTTTNIAGEMLSGRQLIPPQIHQKLKFGFAIPWVLVCELSSPPRALNSREVCFYWHGAFSIDFVCWDSGWKLSYFHHLVPPS